MLKFEEYLADFGSTVSLPDFLVNLLVATILGLALKAYYVRFGLTIANREKFASNFVPLALTTLLVITVVQTSIALSLGLVGALSIVRFRAAIKEPEELTYLFLSIGIGLVTGANKPVLGLLGVSLILILMYINSRFRSKSLHSNKKMYINLKTNLTDLNDIIKPFEEILPYVEMKRMDSLETGTYISFVVKSESVDQLDKLRKAIKGIDSSATFSIVDQPNLVL